jgi:HD-GYP domain-containing protein (c-di-GMP phosphodiesterase class II)
MLAHFPELREEADLVYCHHERYDGTGYPRQLRAENIPLPARIFSIVDTVDAITSDRPYRSAQSLAAARSEVQEMSGTQFDPALVKMFMTIPDEKINEIRMTFPDTRPAPALEPRAAGTAGSEESLEPGLTERPARRPVRSSVSGAEEMLA